MKPESTARDRTVHASRTMMFGELSALLSEVPAGRAHEDYRNAILDDNVLLKPTASNRQKSLRFLRELYALDPVDPIFGPLSRLWLSEPSEGGRALLALLAAAYSDELLAPTCEAILSVFPGEPLGKLAFAHYVEQKYPGRFGEKSLAKIGRNVASTWTQSRHLKGRVSKVRARVAATPATTAFAFYLGWLEGQRGLLLYTTTWARLLDSEEPELDSLLFAAAQRGWLEYKRIADVVEIDFQPLADMAGMQESTDSTLLGWR